MRISVILPVLFLAFAPRPMWATQEPASLCAPLRAFAASVHKDQAKSIEFHTSWLADFKGGNPKAIGAFTRCFDQGYAPAHAVCSYLSKKGAVEFAGNNARQALVCLLPGTRFGQHDLAVDALDVSFYFGTPQHGSNMTIRFDPDQKMGGMVLTIIADGY
jgi:hypothetical protein